MSNDTPTEPWNEIGDMCWEEFVNLTGEPGERIFRVVVEKQFKESWHPIVTWLDDAEELADFIAKRESRGYRVVSCLSFIGQGGAQ